MERVVIVGASLAGVHAAEALREFGYTGDLTLVGSEEYLPYERPPLSKEALASGPRAADLSIRELGWFEDTGIDLRTGTRAMALDPRSQVVATNAGEFEYDGLVIATGSQARTHSFEGEGVHVLRTLKDAERIHELLTSSGRLVVIGAGFLGLEVASTAAELGLEVTVIELAPEPLSRVLGDEIGAWFRHYFARRGVTFHCGGLVSSIARDESGAVQVRGSFGEATGDFAVIAIGAEPSIEWLRTSGLSLSDGVLCDETLTTSVPNVVAAGDVVRWYNPLFDESMRIEQWTNAVEQGRQAAATLLGERAAYSPVPYLWSDVFDVRMRFVGRSNGADFTAVHDINENSFVGVFGRHGVQIGAVCINATRELAKHRTAIAERRDIREIGPELRGPAAG